MTLGWAMEHAPDELLADFQQTYGLNAWALGVLGDETTADVLRAAALAAQLPHNSRTFRVMEPSLQNGTIERLLRQIELNQRSWAWAHSKDAKNNVNEPQPMTLPGEQESVEAARERAEADAMAVASAFHIDI